MVLQFLSIVIGGTVADEAVAADAVSAASAAAAATAAATASAAAAAATAVTTAAAAAAVTDAMVEGDSIHLLYRSGEVVRCNVMMRCGHPSVRSFARRYTSVRHEKSLRQTARPRSAILGRLYAR